MEAARVAAARGHRVSLVEKAGQLGGTLRFAALMYEPNERLLRWLEGQVRALPIELQLNREATPDRVRELGPDVVIAAVGAARERPEIPGATRSHVFDGDDLRQLLAGEGGHAAGGMSLIGKHAVRAGRLLGVTDDPGKLRQASRAWMPVGKRVVIVGGGLVGAELAEFLAERGREVVVLEEGPVVAAEMAHPRRWRVLHGLREAGVRLYTGARLQVIENDLVRFEVALREEEPASQEAPADTVILATGLVANPEPVALLAKAGVEVVTVGDAGGVGYLEGAIHQGFHAAIAL
jgi:2,4-dienoyl-CoA reductase (NADPH2)